MSKKHPKKLHCICKGKPDRVHQGSDHQRHTAQCPLSLNMQRRA